MALSAFLLAAEPKAQPEVKFNLPEDAGFSGPKKLVFVKAGAPGPGHAKHQALLDITILGKPAKLPEAGPFDMWWVPQHGGMDRRRVEV